MTQQFLKTIIGTFALLTATMCLPSIVLADGAQCGNDDQPPCPVERVEITGNCGAVCVGPGTGVPGQNGDSADPWQSAAGSASSSTADKAIKLIKKVNSACKSANESCAEWAARMLTPAGLPVLNGDGVPSGKTGMGICSIAGFSASICYLNISEIAETPVACALLSCPAG